MFTAPGIGVGVRPGAGSPWGVDEGHGCAAVQKYPPSRSVHMMLAEEPSGPSWGCPSEVTVGVAVPSTTTRSRRIMDRWRGTLGAMASDHRSMTYENGLTSLEQRLLKFEKGAPPRAS